VSTTTSFPSIVDFLHFRFPHQEWARTIRFQNIAAIEFLLTVINISQVANGENP